MIGSIRDRRARGLPHACQPEPACRKAGPRRRLGVQPAERGFTLIEVLIGAVVFAVIAVSIYQSYIAIAEAGRSARLKVTAVALANEQLEIIRNLPYPDVGIVGGIPPGKIPRTQTLTRGGAMLHVETTIRNVDDPFDGTLGGAPNDTAPADVKIVELRLTCPTCARFQTVTITTHVGPRNLESATNNGALFIQVLDANGLPVQGANIHVQNDTVTPAIVVDDTTNTGGLLHVVDVPPGVNAYQITVTKAGYSTDRTYPVGDPANPNPVTPHATVAAQTLTQLTLFIDRVSTFTISSVNETCTAVGGVNFTLNGSKKIGTNPDVLKYTANHVTGANGTLTLNTMEWDTYLPTLTSPTYELLGSAPMLPLTLLPNTAQPVLFVVGEKDARTLLVTVHDSALLPIGDATVTLTGPGTNETVVTQVPESGCVPPGQAVFRGLGSGNDTLTVTRSGYQSFSGPVSIAADWQQQDVPLAVQ